MKCIRLFASALTLLVALIVGMGCGQADRKGSDGKGTNVVKHKGGHEHGSGPHGGAVGDWGSGEYHFEFKPNHETKEATVWILAGDEKTPVPITANDGQIAAKVTGMKTNDTFDMVLKADPEKGDPKGKSSRFVGKHEKIGIEQEFKGIVSGEADGTPYFGDFEEKAETPQKK